MSDVNDLIEVVGVADSFPKLDDDCNYWTQLTVAESFTIPEQKPDIEQLTKVVARVKIFSQKIVRTPRSCGCNPAGQKVTGKKLIIEGKLKQKVFYAADVEEQSIHAAHFQQDFSTFIVVPKKTKQHNKFRIDPYIEDVFVKQKGKRKGFKNVALFLHAVPTDCCCY